MNQMRMLLIFGTRPEAIKMAPIVNAMNRQPELFDVRICITAQHREMLDHVLNLFCIQPHYDLDLMQKNQTLCGLTSRLFQSLDEIVGKENPEWLLVQGDTTTAMVAGLVGYYHRVKIGHVEAGLRTYNKYHPFPEEINRRITGTITDLHFAPTEWAKNNLLNEGVDERSIVITGNTVIDAFRQVVNRQRHIKNEQLTQIPRNRRILLVTAHRRENFGKSLDNICSALRIVAREYYGDVHIVYPVHLNPNVKKSVSKFLYGVENITILEPLEYHSFVHLMNRSYLIITDSGGLQEEAPSLGKPVLVLRDTTERPEAVQAGVAKVIGTRREDVLGEVKYLLDHSSAYQRMACAENPYGDGHAAEKICEALLCVNTEKVRVT